MKKDKNAYIQQRINDVMPSHAVDNYNHFREKVLPRLKENYLVSILHTGTMQTRVINESNGKRLDYYPFYRKVNDLQYKNWRILANDGEIETVIEFILR